MYLMSVLFVISASLSNEATSLRIIKFVVPTFKLRGETAIMDCEYELNNGGSNNQNGNTYSEMSTGNEYRTRHYAYDSNEQPHDQSETLYSVKWYKDNEEFYRYVPLANPPQHSYKVEGIQVDHQQSNTTRVTLRSLTLKSSGLYRCEVSGEAPSFSSAQDESRMEIVYLPRSGPHITGEEHLYQIGDILNLNCTSGKSHPASALQWHINDELVMSSDLLIHYPNVIHTHGLITTTLGLQLPVEGRHFHEGAMRVKCVASVSSVLWQGGQESILQRQPLALIDREAMLLVRSHAITMHWNWFIKLVLFITVIRSYL